MHKHGTAGDCFKRLQYLQQFDSQLIAYPARSYISCTASPTAHLNSASSSSPKNSLQRCYASLCDLSTAAVNNCAKSK